MGTGSSPCERLEGRLPELVQKNGDSWPAGCSMGSGVVSTTAARKERGCCTLGLCMTDCCQVGAWREHMDCAGLVRPPQRPGERAVRVPLEGHLVLRLAFARSAGPLVLVPRRAVLGGYFQRDSGDMALVTGRLRLVDGDEAPAGRHAGPRLHRANDRHNRPARRLPLGGQSHGFLRRMGSQDSLFNILAPEARESGDGPRGAARGLRLRLEKRGPDLPWSFRTPCAWNPSLVSPLSIFSFR